MPFGQTIGTSPAPVSRNEYGCLTVMEKVPAASSAAVVKSVSGSWLPIMEDWFFGFLTKSKFCLTSEAVNLVPSAHVTSLRNVNVALVAVLVHFAASWETGLPV